MWIFDYPNFHIAIYRIPKNDSSTLNYKFYLIFLYSWECGWYKGLVMWIYGWEVDEFWGNKTKKKFTSFVEWMGRRGSKLTWKTVTVAHKKLLKCLRSHSQRGCLLIISGQVHSLSPNSSSIYLQNLPPNRYMPSMLQLFVIYRICIYGIFGLFLSGWIFFVSNYNKYYAYS